MILIQWCICYSFRQKYQHITMSVKFIGNISYVMTFIIIQTSNEFKTNIFVDP
jgi:hypothetical protein